MLALGTGDPLGVMLEQFAQRAQSDLLYPLQQTLFAARDALDHRQRQLLHWQPPTRAGLLRLRSLCSVPHRRLLPTSGTVLFGQTHSQAGREPPLPIQISTWAGASPCKTQPSRSLRDLDSSRAFSSAARRTGRFGRDLWIEALADAGCRSHNGRWYSVSM